MTRSVGLISLGAYLPGKAISASTKETLLGFLQNTYLPKGYLDEIAQTGRLPGRIETNYDGWQKHPWFSAWLENLPPNKKDDPFQGTSERRRVPLDPESLSQSVIPHPMLPSDAETIAGSLALVNGNIPKSDIDLLITSSQVPDLRLPPNASLVQHKLQLPNAGAFEVDSCCSSFLSALEVAEGLVRAGIKKKVLIVTSYIDSIVTDKSNYFSVNTGDAAIAGVVSTVADGYGYVSSHSSSNGSRHNAIILQRRSPQLVKGPGFSSFYEQEFVTFYNPKAAKEIAENSKKDMSNVVHHALGKAELSVSDLDFLVTHQPVHWAGHAWREALGFPPNKFHETFKKYGNIANCSVATNLLEAIELKLIKEGDKVLLASSGAGENHVAIVERVTGQLINAVVDSKVNTDEMPTPGVPEIDSVCPTR